MTSEKLDTLVRLNFLGFLPSEKDSKDYDYISVIKKAFNKKQRDKEINKERKKDKKGFGKKEPQRKSRDIGVNYYWDERIELQKKLKEGKDVNVLSYATFKGDTGDAIVRQLSSFCDYKNIRRKVNPAELGLFPQEGSKTLDKFVEELSKAYRNNRDIFLNIAEEMIFSRTGNLQKGGIAPVFLPDEHEVILSVYDYVKERDLDIDMRRIVDGFDSASIDKLIGDSTNMNLYWFGRTAGNIPLEGAAYRMKVIERFARKAAKKLIDLIREYEVYRKRFDQLNRSLKEQGKKTLDKNQFKFIVNYNDLVISDMLGLGLILRKGRRIYLSSLLQLQDLDWLIIKTRDPATEPTTRDMDRSKKLEQEHKLFFDKKSGLFYDVHLAFLRGVILDKLGLEDPHHVYVEKIHKDYSNDPEFGSLYKALRSGYKQLLSRVEQPSLEERARELVIDGMQRRVKSLETKERHIRDLYRIREDEVREIAEKGKKERGGKVIIVSGEGGEKRYAKKGMPLTIRTAWEDLFESYLYELEQIIHKPIDEIFDTGEIRTVYKGTKVKKEMHSLPYVEALEPLVTRIETYLSFAQKHLGIQSKFYGRRKEIRKRLKDLRKLAEEGGNIFAKRRELVDIILTSKPKKQLIDEFSKKVIYFSRTEIKLKQERKRGKGFYNKRVLETRLYCLITALDSYTDMLSFVGEDELTEQEQSFVASAWRQRNRLVELYKKENLKEMTSEQQNARYRASVRGFHSVYNPLKKMKR